MKKNILCTITTNLFHYGDMVGTLQYNPSQ